jgi:DNA primase
MTQETNQYELAAKYHEALPDRIRAYLNRRGIPDSLVDLYLLGWNGRRITIPIFNHAGELAFFKFAKDPADKSASPKMLTTRGASVELYGWEDIQRLPPYLIICEGEFDRLVLKAQGFSAVTSTGGAGVFREEWVRALGKIPRLYICYDHDDAGRRGACKVGQLLPHAKLVPLPADVGNGGDVTDFFVRLGRSREDFIFLLKQAEPVPSPSEPVIQVDQPKTIPMNARLRQRIERIKRAVFIVGIVGRYTKLRSSGDYLAGLCPLHSDHNPSLAVYPTTGTFHCYGCLKHGDVITFVQEIEHITFGQALDVLESVRIYQHGGPSQPSK